MVFEVSLKVVSYDPLSAARLFHLVYYSFCWNKFIVMWSLNIKST